MADRPARKMAGPSFNGQIQPDDPQAPHDLIIKLQCATEAAAYQLMMDFASKMRVQCWGLDDHGDNRSLPPAGTEIRLVTRGGAEHQIGTATVIDLKPS